jgi:hypothetical protein
MRRSGLREVRRSELAQRVEGVVGVAIWNSISSMVLWRWFDGMASMVQYGVEWYYIALHGVAWHSVVSIVNCVATLQVWVCLLVHMAQRARYNTSVRRAAVSFLAPRRCFQLSIWPLCTVLLRIPLCLLTGTFPLYSNASLASLYNAVAKASVSGSCLSASSREVFNN